MNFIIKLTLVGIGIVILVLHNQIPVVFAQERFSFADIDQEKGYSYEFPKTVQLIINGQRRTYITYVETIADLIAEQHIIGDITYGNYSANTKLRNGLTVFLIQRITATTLETENIPFAKKQWYVNDLPNGEKKIVQQGIDGLKLVKKEKVFVGNSVESEKTVYEEILAYPVTEITNIGTTKHYKVLTLENGEQIQYIRELYVRATSYDHTCKGCNNTTATGRYLTKGIVAVDPKVIPMHTHMYIPGYGYGQAEDTGGAIKGNRIDLAYDDIHFGNWHTQWLTIYLLE